MRNFILKLIVVLGLFCSNLYSQNVLLLIADDTGKDKYSCYGLPGASNTPNIDALAAQGIRFNRCYSNPVCSPSRSCMITGQYSSTHFIGKAIAQTEAYGLNPLLPNLLPKCLPSGYLKVALGKWHLTSSVVGEGYHPLFCGFDLHSGSLYNINNSNTYFLWEKSTNGTTYISNTYATTDTANDCITALNYLNTVPNPWFIWCAFNASHEPLHIPPNTTINGIPTVYQYVNKMTEYMDTEIGRILANVNMNNTTVIFVSDNGSVKNGMHHSVPYRGGKTTVYEGGINVPMIIAGKDVGWTGTSERLVSLTDIFNTILSITAQSQITNNESVSIYDYMKYGITAGERQYVFSEYFTPNGSTNLTINRKAVIGPRYKLVHRNGFQPEFFDLVADPFESTLVDMNNLSPNEQIEYNNLTNIINGLGL